MGRALPAAQEVGPRGREPQREEAHAHGAVVRAVAAHQPEEALPLRRLPRQRRGRPVEHLPWRLGKEEVAAEAEAVAVAEAEAEAEAATEAEAPLMIATTVLMTIPRVRQVRAAFRCLQGFP